MPYDPNDPRLTAFALGELEPEERAALEAELAEFPESQHLLEEIRITARLLTEQLRNEPSPGLGETQKRVIQGRLDRHGAGVLPFPSYRWLGYAAAASLLLASGFLAFQASRQPKTSPVVADARKQGAPFSVAMRTDPVFDTAEKPRMSQHGRNFAPAQAGGDVSAAETAVVALRGSLPATASNSPETRDELDTSSPGLSQEQGHLGAPMPGPNDSLAYADTKPDANGTAGTAEREVDPYRGLARESGEALARRRPMSAAAAKPGEPAEMKQDLAALHDPASAPPLVPAPVAPPMPGNKAESAPANSLASAPPVIPGLGIKRSTLPQTQPGSDKRGPKDQPAERDQSTLFFAGAQNGNAGNAPSVEGMPEQLAQNPRALQDGDQLAGPLGEAKTREQKNLAGKPQQAPASVERFSRSATRSKKRSGPALGDSAMAMTPGNSLGGESRSNGQAPARPNGKGGMMLGPSPANAGALNGTMLAPGAVSGPATAPDRKAKATLQDTTAFKRREAAARSEPADRPQDFALDAAPRDSKQNVNRLIESQLQLADQPAEVAREAFPEIVENEFKLVRDEPLSTFSIDVDTASYANVRRFLSQGAMPPKDAVRVEEMVNYFRYDDPEPSGDIPFSANVEIARCPWNADHRLARIGLKGRTISYDQRKASNLVFLIDVSGSMGSPNKLPLLKSAMQMLVESLGEKDRVAIVVYASAEGLVLPSTSCYRKGEVLSALEQLQAGGSTNGGAGIKLAYQIAEDPHNFIKEGINRVILCTDGDFNVGVTDDGDLNRLIEAKRKSGVFLTVLGFGEGNLQERKLKGLATHGNGNYHYVDTLAQARKVLVEEGGSTLVTIAKDVKIQVEFNPAKVSAFRQIGYELRQMAHADFNNDAKDAGEIGAGHSVTALYELVPAGKEDVPDLAKQTDLVFQKERALAEGELSKNALMVRIKYKRPTEDKSEPEIRRGVEDNERDYAQASNDFKFAAAVASFGLVLRDSKYKGSATLASVEELAKASLGTNPSGYRNEFIELIQKAQAIAKQQPAPPTAR